MAKKNWIAGAIKHKGALHEQLGVASDKKIPAKKLASARAGNYGPTAQKRANLAKTLASFEEGGMIPQTGSYTMHKGERVIPAATSHEGECRRCETPAQIAARKQEKRFDW